MPLRSFDYCALQFLNQWLEKEEMYCRQIASTDVEMQRQALIAAGGHFRVARNVPTEYEKKENLPRYQPVLDVLKNTGHVDSSNVVEIIKQAQKSISGHYGKRNVLSLTTKFMWLKFKSPVRIYDSQARKALKAVDGDFSDFNAKFSARYAGCREDIENACGKLSAVVGYTTKSYMSQQDLQSLVSQEWFKERVLDIYLWNEGNA